MPALTDITLGRYVPAQSPLHHLDPRTKLLASVVLMAAVLSAPGFGALGTFCALLAAGIGLSRLPPALILRNLRPFMWLFVFTVALNALLIPGTLLWAAPRLGLQVTREGLTTGAFFAARLAAVIATASLFTLTTAPLELTSGLERLLSPFRRVGLPAHELAMMITIALRFIPVLVEEAERLRKAQLARGADFGGGPVRRVRQLMPLLVPLFVSAFERADRLALAMESRGYRGGEGRSSFHELRFHRCDLWAAMITAAAAGGILWIPHAGGR
jgi:energy-coupling factor transport system permease protein